MKWILGAVALFFLFRSRGLSFVTAQPSVAGSIQPSATSGGGTVMVPNNGPGPTFLPPTIVPRPYPTIPPSDIGIDIQPIPTFDTIFRSTPTLLNTAQIWNNDGTYNLVATYSDGTQKIVAQNLMPPQPDAINVGAGRDPLRIRYVNAL